MGKEPIYQIDASIRTELMRIAQQIALQQVERYGGAAGVDDVIEIYEKLIRAL